MLKIQQKYYGTHLREISEEISKFYISGIYFTEIPDIDKFIEYAKWLKNTANKAFSRSMINYALIEVLAEYKRYGISKKDVLKTMLGFNPLFLVKEIIRRKRAAKKDIEKCMKTARDLGLIQTSGTKEFPIFEKDSRCLQYENF